MRSDLSRMIGRGAFVDAEPPKQDVVVAIERGPTPYLKRRIAVTGTARRELRAAFERELDQSGAPDIAPQGEVTRVNLSLSREAAIFLRSLMGHIAGPPHGSRRFADEILCEMEEAWGEEMPRYDFTHDPSKNDGRKMVVGRLDAPEHPRLIKGYGADQREVTK